jgi:predicted Zn-dependent peptidase
MLNRKSAPAIHELRHLTLPAPTLTKLDNGMQVYALSYPHQEILKLEAVFMAGRAEEQKRLASRATSRLLRDGTARMTGAEIAETLDFYGASLSVPTNLDTSSFVLYGLRKYAEETVPIFADMLKTPSFPSEEIENFKKNSVQELLVELEKVETLAYRKLTELIFGENHPYGYNSTVEDYLAIQRDDLLNYYQAWYRPDNCTIFVTGNIDERLLQLLNQQLGQWQPPVKHNPLIANRQWAAPKHQLPTANPHVLTPARPSLQTAIKVGRGLFNRNHPDFNGLLVLNTVLGGYFGSRLMTNIREKKGYTYNIYSTVDAYLHDGCLYIATEVSPKKARYALKAIWSEVKKLREQPIPDEELSMVRNYMMGMILNGLDGPINTSDLVRNLIVEKQTPDAFEALVRTIRDISPAELQRLASEYLQEKDFWVVTAG